MAPLFLLNLVRVLTKRVADIQIRLNPSTPFAAVCVDSVVQSTPTTIYVSGWGFAHNEFAVPVMVVDGVELSSVMSTLPRPDVVAAYSMYVVNGNCGCACPVSIDQFAPGYNSDNVHTVALRIYAANGRMIESAPVSITVVP